ncbi:hypothetical protein NKW55_15675 [Gluconobacter kondonii]|uniref:Arc-like DNA binding domain-containing protein n=1 Tax=Gluconobacter kondonii TaxID=941463 RepID=A0ABQ5WVM7_9PROT|nr:hypothetical protein [Gluconobacter kondonii]MCP1237979.1 hypothetical protein [Gluconobacter kondonii]GBR41253.1 hypothetical protein AA3266_2768 [Gluconobacter kondonii NBRC 3266]GLQ67551.1 hypothetical protein GCM10007870_31360 [Gluconobacter kondonii]
MIDSAPDTWFKLRLSGPLRARLEEEAATRGLTLTAEILRRIESTLDGTDNRVSKLEELTGDGDWGNRALWDNFGRLYDEIEKLRAELETTKDYAGVPRYDPD